MRGLLARLSTQRTMAARDNDGSSKSCFAGSSSGSSNRFRGRGSVFLVDLGHIRCYSSDASPCKAVICVINFHVMCKGFFLIL